MSGQSRWVTGPESRRLGHQLRAEHDAILVGSGTVRSDDPELTVRLVPGDDPLRVVLDSRLTINKAARIFGDTPHRVLIITTAGVSQTAEERIRQLGASVEHVEFGVGGVSIDAALQVLADRGVHSVLVEGGPRVATSFLRARSVDQVIALVAPTILGSGTPAVGDLGIEHMNDAIRLDEVELDRAGLDWIVRGRPVWSVRLER
jgi:riboflavin-specific deaminase-like protein